MPRTRRINGLLFGLDIAALIVVAVAWATQRWFDGPPRPRQAPGGGDRGLFVLGFGYGRTGVMYFAPPLQPGAASQVFVVPHWGLFALMLVWPVRRAIRQRREDRS